MLSFGQIVPHTHTHSFLCHIPIHSKPKITFAFLWFVYFNGPDPIISMVCLCFFLPFVKHENNAHNFNWMPSLFFSYTNTHRKPVKAWCTFFIIIVCWCRSTLVCVLADKRVPVFIIRFWHRINVPAVDTVFSSLLSVVCLFLSYSLTCLPQLYTHKLIFKFFCIWIMKGWLVWNLFEWARVLL